MIQKRTLYYSLAFLCILSLTGCSTPAGDRPFYIKNLAKSDIDLVADAHIDEINRLSRELTIKLYQRNPRELAKAPAGTSIDDRLALIFNTPRIINHPELFYRYGIDSFPLVFDPNFTGDRVFALMIGISGMFHAAYNYQDQFFLFDSLDQQKLYNSARNLEIIIWRLSHLKLPSGEPFLLTNGVSDDGIFNLSFERLFGKMIAHQDMMARIISDKTNRTVNKAFFSLATTALFPI
ncbi:hypothetical protein DN062_14450 [Nitrincola tibetensis]|uniref:Lipoprotein n=1 Tax=Nitrincola tibetensis TaxID=2219697 RepID=A0A364NJ69_9GAMM|nr:hypothetical protein [Nitrincola tibetensis]RAU17112.1 hypothetical protein DN062_14450 [Nitrincola tibetensis]